METPKRKRRCWTWWRCKRARCNPAGSGRPARCWCSSEWGSPLRWRGATPSQLKNRRATLYLHISSQTFTLVLYLLAIFYRQAGKKEESVTYSELSQRTTRLFSHKSSCFCPLRKLENVSWTRSNWQQQQRCSLWFCSTAPPFRSISLATRREDEHNGWEIPPLKLTWSELVKQWTKALLPLSTTAAVISKKNSWNYPWLSPP